MHGRLAKQTKLQAIFQKRPTRMWSVAAVAIACVVAGLYFGRDTIHDWFVGPTAAPAILVSGNIEAHQSVLAFKTVQSRIVELPFDEGKWVEAGTLIARLDDSDYRQQVAINEAALEMQQRQLAAAEQNLMATRQTVARD